MTIDWATMQLYILEGLLKDVPGTDQQVTSIQLTAYARWAMAELSQHTALADTYIYDCDGSTSSFVLPSDMVDGVEKTGLLGYSNRSGVNYLPPYHRIPEVIWPMNLGNTTQRQCYWEWPTGRLTLGFTPAVDEQIILYYFRIWPVPTLPEDILTFPQWMEQAFAYLVASAVMVPYSTQSAKIRTWNRKQDSGTPEDNPAQKQSRWFVDQANRILNKVQPQDRENFYLLSQRKISR